MHSEIDSPYPYSSTIARTIQVGGLTRLELLEQLQRNGIALNESADQLLASDLFTTAASRYSVTSVELTIEGVLWLRGYRSGPEHLWGPGDHFIFCRA